ncbi:MAG: class I SAM-dependent methyltransferase [Patescibacteria group bacterium]
MFKKKANTASKYYFNHPQVWTTVRQRSLDREIIFLDSLFSSKRNINKVLDVGCGSGIHCHRLQELGYKTTGIDLNRHMIKYAKTNYPNLNFFKQDMKNITLKTTFDAIICLCTTFSFNLTNDQIQKTLAGFNKLLKKDGVLVIEVLNPISFLSKNRFTGSFFRENLKYLKTLNLRIDLTHKVDEKNQILNEVRKTYSLKTNKLLSEDVTQFRLLFPQELSFHLKEAGFKVNAFYGRYRPNYTELDKTRLIVISQKVGT